MKKRYLLASMMVLAAVSLAGCGGNSASKASTSVASEASTNAASNSTETSSVDDAKADTSSKDTTDTTTDEPSDPDADSSASTEASSTADNDSADAQAFIGVSFDEFKNTFGQPTSSSASDGDNGEKVGTYTYDKFTVTTHTDSDGNEIVDSVE